MPIVAMALMAGAGVVGLPVLLVQHHLTRWAVSVLALGCAALLAGAGLVAVGAREAAAPLSWLAGSAVLGAVGSGAALTLGVLGLTSRRNAPAGPNAGPATRATADATTGSAAGTAASAPAETAGTAVRDDAADPGERLLRGGALIGVFERVAVVATLLSGWPEGLAVLLALKGLGRFPELRSSVSEGASERFILGTLVSALTAAACAGIAGLLL